MRWIWRALTRRLLLKFIALLCAVVLWVYAWSVTSSVRTITTTISLPVSTDMKASVVMPGDILYPPWSIPIRVTVRGPVGVVLSLEPMDLRKSPSTMETPLVGDSRVRLDETDFVVPGGVVIVRIEPQELLVRVSEQLDGKPPKP